MNNPSPVRLVQVEVGNDQRETLLNVDKDQRLWIEVSKAGQIVGVVERRADEQGISVTTVKAVTEEYSQVEVAKLADIADERLPRASVVVPTIYRRVDLLEQTVKSLLALDYPNFEIIVVDNRVGSGHTPIPEFSDDPRVRISVERTLGASSARNRGIAESTGEFVAFTDDDVQVDRNWLRALAVAFVTDPTVEAIGGMVRPSELDTEAQLWFEEFYGGFTKSFTSKQWSLELMGDSDPLFPYSAGHFGAGCNMAVRREALGRIRGFDVRLGAGTLAKGAEDLKVFIEIILSGGKVAYVPSALVRHSHRRSEREFMEQVFGYGTGLTALFTDLIMEDPRHLVNIVRRIPRGLRMLLSPEDRRSPSTLTSYPRHTQFVQLLGMAYGPVAFFRSSLQLRSATRRRTL